MISTSRAHDRRSIPREVMSTMQKLFGNSSSARFVSDRKGNRKPRKQRRLRPLKVILVLVIIVEILYCLAIFSGIPFIVRLRNMYIETAMSTMTHRWLATAFIPGDIIDEVVSRRNAAADAQIGQNSTWTVATTPAGETVTTPVATAPAPTDPEGKERELTPEQEAFFQLFWELDQNSMFAYVDSHPEAVSGGWDKIKINEAGLDDEGTTIQTIMGEQVLAIDAENQLLLLRVTGSAAPGFSYRGVLAVAKDPSRLTLCPSKGIGSYGQHAGSIAEANNGILAMTGSGFIDEGGGGNGGTLAGACMCQGERYGKHFGWMYKRIELHEDNRLYITDAPNSFGEGTTDAVEFWPALIIDGENAIESDTIFTEMNPRACLGQSRREEILMLVIEGRLVSSQGADAMECAEILARHDCYQAMNLDGGTSAIMWYDGEYITRCSNTALDEGRYLPNAWIYAAEPIE